MPVEIDHTTMMSTKTNKLIVYADFDAQYRYQYQSCGQVVITTHVIEHPLWMVFRCLEKVIHHGLLGRQSIFLSLQPCRITSMGQRVHGILERGGIWVMIDALFLIHRFNRSHVIFG